MNDEQQQSVLNKLKEIENEISRHNANLKKLRDELIVHALYFESYIEMYSFIQSHTPNIQAFNLDMFEARELFFKKKEIDNYKYIDEV